MNAPSPNDRHTVTLRSAQIRQNRTLYVRKTLGKTKEQMRL